MDSIIAAAARMSAGKKISGLESEALSAWWTNDTHGVRWLLADRPK